MVVNYDRAPKKGTLAQRVRRERMSSRIDAVHARFYGSPRQSTEARLHDQRLESTLAQNQLYDEDITREDIEPDEGWNPPPVDSDDDFDRAVYADRARWRQKAKDFNWTSVMPTLHTWYITCRIMTKNWTEGSFDDQGRCICAPHKLTRRWVDLVDVTCQARTRFAFCQCTSDAVRLLQHGYLAASPLAPQTAFSIHLMLLHNSLWNNCRIDTQPFMVAITEWLEPRSGRLYARGKKHACELRQPFSAAVDLYQKLDNMAKDTLFSALRQTPQEIQASEGCPACFGPRPPNHADYPPRTRNKVVFCLDGNFQHRHHTNAGREHRAPEIPRIFVPPSEFSAMQVTIRAKEIELCPPSKADRCTDSHKAADDKRNEATWKGCDDTGLMGACCRHDAAIFVGNIYKSGEQRCLPVTLVDKLIAHSKGDRQIGILYDIGCSLDKYMGTYSTPTCTTGYASSIITLGLMKAGVFPTERGSNDCGPIAHRLKYHNWRGKRDLPKWLKKKFTSAVKRRLDARLVLEDLSQMRNPHESAVVNYTPQFFKRQWSAQRQFQKEHTEAEADRRTKLVKYYKQEVVVELLRKRLQGPEIFLSTEQELLDLLASITEHSEELRRQLDELTGEGDMRSVIDDEETKLLLLLWEAKADLFVQSVHYQAENRPISDSKTRGSRTGTRLKEKVFQAQASRKTGVKRYIDTFNRRYLNYITRFPDQTLSDAADYPLTYDAFIAFPMDHRFWNDGLYYHCKAPWAIDANVRAGITATLTLDRVQEEFQFLAQELCRAVGWGVAYYQRLRDTIRHLRGRLATLDVGNIALQPDYIDAIPIDGAISRSRYKMIIKMCEADLENHGTLMDDWSEHISWLWTRCQPEGNRGYIADWDQMIRKIRRGNPTEDQPQVEEEIEAAVLEVGLDDGEDADVALIAAAEGGISNDVSDDVPNDVSNNVSNDVSNNVSNDVSNGVFNDNNHNVGGDQGPSGGAVA
ncbi:hypothetical protein Pst134EA_022874 [Puccinia striiformis f. sp. tritici]|uniref:hypothetical protein n=1 Tax=Puccinia striiformis f. sp. tritici TaxID=168172 RepID=UPI002007A420|nr:hypothetical protein Pst134EA_022874 [Puccinia striiformis f. sp. tritici]KAH9455406.1 hypothetical protein Pst134EA_022874 [Puccinia striiformis f. sp. tritici]